MKKVLVEIVAQYALFLEEMDESDLPLESIVRRQEDMSFLLQKMSSEERAEFVRLLGEVASAMRSSESQEILGRLPSELGLEVE